MLRREGEQRALPLHPKSERGGEQPCQKREKRRSTSNFFSAAKGAIENGRRDNLPKVIGKLGKIDQSAEFAPTS